MSRPLRIQFPGALYHVTSRGNEKRAIFLDDHDRKRRLDWLNRTVTTYGLRLHAFVLMDNHEHLFVETPEPNLSAAMQYLNGSYTGYFNARYERVGHLFQGRYKAILIENEGHYLEVSRYIHLNPVRARMVSHPRQWPWGSYLGYERGKQLPPWVTYSRILGEFGRNEWLARRAYCAFVGEGIHRAPRSPLAGARYGAILGSESFISKVRGLLRNRKADPALPTLRELRPRPAIEDIVQMVGETTGADPTAWARGRRSDDSSRALAAYVARRRYGYSATEIALRLGYSNHSGVNRACNRIASAGRSTTRALHAVEARLTSH